VADRPVAVPRRTLAKILGDPEATLLTAPPR
jgi:hypothetical protein